MKYLGCFGSIQQTAVETMSDCRFLTEKGTVYSCTLRGDEVALIANHFGGYLDNSLSVHLNYSAKKLVLEDVINKIYTKGYMIKICSFCNTKCIHISFYDEFDQIRICIPCLINLELKKDDIIKDGEFYFYEGKTKIYIGKYKLKADKIYKNSSTDQYGSYDDFACLLFKMFECDSETEAIYKPIYYDLTIKYYSSQN